MFFCSRCSPSGGPCRSTSEGKRLVSLAFVFIIASQLIFGWEWSVLIGAGAIGFAMALGRVRAAQGRLQRRRLRDSRPALAALPLLLAAAADRHLRARRRLRRARRRDLRPRERPDRLRRDRASRGTPVADLQRPPAPVGADLRDHGLRRGAGRHLLAALGRRSCCCSSAPLFALTLYQRSSVAARVAEEAASTDSLTGLKNRRAFEEEAARGARPARTAARRGSRSA